VGLLRIVHALASELDLQPSVAHLDHGVRGEAAAADARFVAELAAALGLPLDLGHWRPTRPGHFEADARRARYAWPVEVAEGRRPDARPAQEAARDGAGRDGPRRPGSSHLQSRGPAAVAPVPPRRGAPPSLAPRRLARGRHERPALVADRRPGPESPSPGLGRG